MTAFNDTFGIIGLSSENVGIDRRIYTGLTSTNPQLNVSYNGGRVDVYLNGVKLMGNHSGQSNYDYTYQSTGSGSAITLSTGVALVATDTIECVGYVSNSSNTVTTYTPSVSAGNNTFTSISHTSSDLLNVFLNGVLLDSSDYTADANADTVTITSLASGDVVHIQVIGALDHINFLPESGGTYSGNVNVNGKLVLEVGSTRAIAQDRNGTIQNILWKDTTATDNLNLFNPNSSNLKLGTANTERLSIDSSGNVELKTTNANLILPSGGGIDFSANGGNAETFDSYEEGTFTLSIADHSGSGTPTIDTQNSGDFTNRYVKIGKLILCSIYININFQSNNRVRFSGLPENAVGGGSVASIKDTFLSIQNMGFGGVYESTDDFMISRDSNATAHSTSLNFNIGISYLIA